MLSTCIYFVLDDCFGVVQLEQYNVYGSTSTAWLRYGWSWFMIKPATTMLWRPPFIEESQRQLSGKLTSMAGGVEKEGKYTGV